MNPASPIMLCYAIAKVMTVIFMLRLIYFNHFIYPGVSICHFLLRPSIHIDSDNIHTALGWGNIEARYTITDST